MIEEFVDYTYVDKPTADFYSIKLLSGKWKEVIYTYGRVSLREDIENDTLHLKFDYRIEENVGIKDLENCSDFKNYIGDILKLILENSTAKIGKAPHGAEPTTNDT